MHSTTCNDYINFDIVKIPVNQKSKLLYSLEYIKMLNKLQLSDFITINITKNNNNKDIINIIKKEIEEKILYEIFNLTEAQLISLLSSNSDEYAKPTETIENDDETILKIVETGGRDYSNPLLFQLLIDNNFFDIKKKSIIDNCYNNMTFGGSVNGSDYLCWKLYHNHKNITYLDLQSNNLTDYGLCNLSPLFQCCKNLQTLWLCANCITSVGLKELSNNFRFIPLLKMLGLSYNNISNGIKDFTDNFLYISNLLYLDLVECSLNDYDIQILCEKCHYLSHLQFLNLQSNKITDNISNCMKNCLCKCPLLCKLWINKNYGILHKVEFAEGIKQSHPNKTFDVLY